MPSDGTSTVCLEERAVSLFFKERRLRPFSQKHSNPRKPGGAAGADLWPCGNDCLGGWEKRKKKSPPSNQQLRLPVCESPPKWSTDCKCAAISSRQEAGGGVDPAERDLISRQRSEEGSRSRRTAVNSPPSPCVSCCRGGGAGGGAESQWTLHLTSSNNRQWHEKCHH